MKILNYRNDPNNLSQTGARKYVMEIHNLRRWQKFVIVAIRLLNLGCRDPQYGCTEYVK